MRSWGPNFPRVRPIVRFQPSLAKFGAKFGRVDRHLAGIRPKLPRIGMFWSMLGQHGDRCWPNSAWFWPIWGNLETPAERCSVGWGRPKCGRDRPRQAHGLSSGVATTEDTLALPPDAGDPAGRRTAGSWSRHTPPEPSMRSPHCAKPRHRRRPRSRHRPWDRYHLWSRPNRRR